mmetsp:Transcript_30545/g.46196  ORF Transcript_30545/g.46196 Transcript_30545/m.46196 type:complete len:88 (+) Transcript_30545:355-618(+)
MSELETVPGRSTGLAYKAHSRTHQARGGPIMSFDTSCLVANEWYEIRADVLAQNAGTEEINNCSAVSDCIVLLTSNTNISFGLLQSD